MIRKQLISLLAATLVTLFAAPAFCQQQFQPTGLDGVSRTSATNPMPHSNTGLIPTLVTSVAGSVSTTAASVTIVSPGQHVRIRNTTAATNILYFNVNGTAVTTNFAIPPATEEIFDCAGISTLSVLGSASSTTYSVLVY